MLDSIQSAKYRISQRTRFDDEKRFIEPKENKEVALFIVDTGINDYFDVDFFKTSNFESYRDENGHGTEMAYLVKSVDPSIKIYNAKVTDGEKVVTDELVSLFEQIKQFKISTDVPVIVSCSLQVEDNQELSKAIQECVALEDLTVFCSVGDGLEPYNALPGNVEGVHIVGCLSTDLRPISTSNMGADFFVAGQKVKTMNGDTSGSSVSTVLAATVLSMLYSFVDKRRVPIVFENIIVEEKKQLVWPFVYDVEWESIRNYNLDIKPTVKKEFVFEKANQLAKIIFETPVFSITDNEMLFLNDNHYICTNGELERDQTYQFKLKTDFAKFELESLTLSGYSEEITDNYEYGTVFMNSSFTFQTKGYFN